MKIYTKQGDGGLTSLIGGERVFKTDARVEAYGTVDELTAFVAMLADLLHKEEGMDCYVKELRTMLAEAMTVEALLAVGEGGEGKVAPIAEEHIAELEQLIDAFQAELQPITKFTIPGGHRACSLCHVYRTVCRRAERAALRADQEHGVAQSAKVYLNRLSDLYYTLGRTITLRAQMEELLWRP